MSKKEIGAGAERSALAYLTSQGLALVESNVTCRYGELDLVMTHGDTLVFVEVRFRRHAVFGGALESVYHAKQKKLIRSARWFLQNRPKWSRRDCRFDVVAMDAGGHVDWIQDAFDAPSW